MLVRPLVENDLAQADRIMRVAFGTFMGLPDPSQFMGDTDYVRTRWKADPSAVLAAEHESKLVGSNFAANFGCFGFFGPLTIRPDYWGRGVAQQLLVPTMELFRRWGNRHLGLFTFAQSPKHMALYQKFGFWPRDLVSIMAKQVDSSAKTSSPDARRFSELTTAEREQALADCRDITDAIFAGLDVTSEIRAVLAQRLGDTLLVYDGSRLSSFAVCHVGAGTEAGSGVCYVKFAAVRPGKNAGRHFADLLHAAEGFAHSAGVQKLVAGVNLARREAFTEMFARGFRAEIQGVAMETGDASSGYNHAGTYVLDDWR
jgi:GNAT superfamily N-acetyltransferase